MKKYLTKLTLMAVVGVAGTGFAGADTWDTKTVITTEEAMQLPNMMLQPGTYVIRLAPNTGERHIVQIFDKDEKHLVTTILALPNERVRVSGKSVFAFWEVPAGQPNSASRLVLPGGQLRSGIRIPEE